MAASASDSAASKRVPVMVKTLSGELIPIEIDPSKGHSHALNNALKSLHRISPQNFPLGKTTLKRPLSNNSGANKSGRLNQVTEDEVLWSFVNNEANSLVSLANVYNENNNLLYVFHISREEDAMELIEVSSPDFFNNFNNNTNIFDDFIKENPIQELVIMYNQLKKKWMVTHDTLSGVRDKLARGVKIHSGSSSLMKQLKEDMYVYDEHESVEFRLSDQTVRDILHLIKNHPDTPNNEKHKGGSRRRQRRTRRKHRRTTRKKN